MLECWHMPRITTCSNKLITLSKFCLVYLDSSPETQIRLAGFEGGPVQQCLAFIRCRVSLSLGPFPFLLCSSLFQAALPFNVLIMP